MQAEDNLNEEDVREAVALWHVEGSVDFPSDGGMDIPCASCTIELI